MHLSVSLLSADFSHLREEMRLLQQAGAQSFHLDVMDGHFVPNLTFGAPLISRIAPWAGLPLDVHLMVSPVEQFLHAFLSLPLRTIIIHPQACHQPHQVAHTITQAGFRLGIALNPHQHPRDIEPALWHKSHVAVLMTVQPGFGGQTFLPQGLDGAAFLQKTFPHVELWVDGGITATTAPIASAAGATCLITGSFVFHKGPEEYHRALQNLRQACRKRS